VSGWTKEQWEEFCNQHSINAARAFRSGEIRLDTAHEQPAKKRTKGAPTSRVSHTLRKQNPDVALEPPTSRTQPQLADSGRKPRVHIIIRGCRLRFLDQDNFVGSCKALVDGLCRAGLAPDDSAKAMQAGELRIDYEQQLVTAYTKECTEIEITWNT
jgi:hypothetical protein